MHESNFHVTVFSYGSNTRDAVGRISSSRADFDVVVDISYAAPQAHGIVNLALHQEYSSGIVFIFSQGRKDMYHV
jgi:hypothetical protein